jgi:hypothetical protein
LSYSLTTLAVVGLSAFSYFWAVTPEKDGMAVAQKNLTDYYHRYTIVAQQIEPDSIIIVDRMDKMFFPKYQVIVFLQNYTIFHEINKIIDNQPIYYFSDMKDQEIQSLNQEKLSALNLNLELKQVIDDEYRLFELNKK